MALIKGGKCILKHPKSLETHGHQQVVHKCSAQSTLVGKQYSKCILLSTSVVYYQILPDNKMS